MGDLWRGAEEAWHTAFGTGNIIDNFSRELTPQNQFQVNAPLSQAEYRQIAQGGQQQLAQTQAGQQALAQALLAQTQGQGPDIAGEALRQATGQLAQQQAGFMASQKGVNPAQAARLAAQAGAQMGQQAAGQAGLMRMQQQQQAQQTLGGLYGQMAQTGLGTITGATEAAMAPERVRAGIAAQNTAARQGTSSGLLGGIGSMLQGKFFADGGTVPEHYAMGAMVPMAASVAGKVMSGKQGDAAEAMKAGFQKGVEASKSIADRLAQESGMAYYPSGTSLKFAAYGGKLDPAYAGFAKLYHDYEHPNVSHLKAVGGPVPGKAPVAGDSYKNDIVPTMLSPGEIVIPRSVVQSQNPVEASAQFVADELGDEVETKEAEDDFKQALKKAISTRKVKK